MYLMISYFSVMKYLNKDSDLPRFTSSSFLNIRHHLRLNGEHICMGVWAHAIMKIKLNSNHNEAHFHNYCCHPLVNFSFS